MYVSLSTSTFGYTPDSNSALLAFLCLIHPSSTTTSFSPRYTNQHHDKLYNRPISLPCVRRAVPHGQVCNYKHATSEYIFRIKSAQLLGQVQEKSTVWLQITTSWKQLLLVCYWPGHEDITLELHLSTVPFSIPTCWCCTFLYACVFSASAKLPTSHTDLYRIGRSVTYFSVKLGCLFYQHAVLHLVGLTTGC